MTRFAFKLTLGPQKIFAEITKQRHITAVFGASHTVCLPTAYEKKGEMWLNTAYLHKRDGKKSCSS